jgi:seryl-tRNA synthetase
MNEQHEYLPVPEFAERAGVSKQAVYSRMKSGSIDEYISEAGGKKRISTAALPFFASRQENVKVDRQEQTTLRDELSEIDNQLDGQNQSNTNKLIEELTNQVKTLGQQIETLIRQNNEKDAKLMEYADKFAELAEKAINTTGQAQLLHAHAITEEEPETVTPEPAQETVEVKQDQSIKNNFLSRILKKRVK